MVILGIDETGGSTTATKRNTTWEAWRQLVLDAVPWEEKKFEPRVEADYRKCYDRGLSVHEAMIEMY